MAFLECLEFTTYWVRNWVQINIIHVSNSLQSPAEDADNECVLTQIHTTEGFFPKAFSNLNEEVEAMDSWLIEGWTWPDHVAERLRDNEVVVVCKIVFLVNSKSVMNGIDYVMKGKDTVNSKVNVQLWKGWNKLGMSVIKMAWN